MSYTWFSKKQLDQMEREVREAAATTKPDWCTQEVWEAALKLADVWQHPMHHDYQIFAEDAARALMEAERRSQQEIERLRREIDHKRKAMSSQAEQWTRSMAEAKCEGMMDAATFLRDHATISNVETLDPAITEILKALYQKAVDH